MVETSHDIGILIELGSGGYSLGRKILNVNIDSAEKNSVIVSQFSIQSVSLVFQGTSASGSSSPARSFASLRPQMTWRQNWHKPLLQLHRGRCPQEGHTSALTSANFGSPGITVWGW